MSRNSSHTTQNETHEKANGAPLGVVSLASAILAPAQEAAPFSFAKWADEIIADPNGNHLSPEEAIAVAVN